MPLVSVVMSVYNGEKFLCESIESILDQTFGDFEFIIVDDASTDNSFRLINSFKDERIRVMRNEYNSGLAVSLNKAIETAEGEFIARQDADDRSYPERLSKQILFLNKYPNTGALGVTTQWIDEMDEEILVWHQPTDNFAIQDTLMQYCSLIHGSTIIRKVAIQEVNGYNPMMRTGQDYDLWLRISELWDIDCLSNVLYAHRRHEWMISKTDAEEQKRHAQEALRQAIQRRLTYGVMMMRGAKSKIPRRLAMMNRSVAADRFISWSSGTRNIDRNVALRFLLFGLALDPYNKNAWKYIMEILSRKMVPHRL